MTSRRSLAALALLAAACGGREAPAPPPPNVSVARPRVQEVIDWDEYTGRLQAIDSVEVRARVSGYLESIHFADGGTVKAGDLLFVIDPRPYEAVLARARGELALSQARLELARKDLARAQQLLKSRAISEEEADTRAAGVRQAEASAAAAKAAVDAAALDVEFTRVVAPVAGRAGRHLVDEGNLVTSGPTGATLLTTIVTLDPIHCYFEADERAYLKYTRLARSGERASSRDVNNPVRVGTADEKDFPHVGWMDFVDNQFDPGTGTMTGRALIPNPELLLSPGLFVRVRLLGSAPYRALLIPDEAIGTDQAQKFVWVLDAENRAQYRRVQVGVLHEGLRVVREGLGPEDRVVVAGLQRVRPGIVVVPEERTSEPQTAAAAPAD
jgi:RND family efflux transporter MFP subunit